MKHLRAVFMIFLFCGFAAAVSAEFAAGAEILPEEISEFYYTLDSSTGSPVFQRYRFYRDHGQKMFYHESRQGGGWPQTEEDIVASGSVELSDAEWNAFAGFLQGGSLYPPADEVTDGDEGPWMYLYRTEDEGKSLEFRFASREKEAEFEEFCSRLAGNHILTRFYFSRGGSMIPQSHEVVCRNDGCFWLQEEEGPSRLFDPDLMAELRQVAAEYDLDSWDGFRGSDPYVLDGENFRLELSYADGETVYASGENEFPKNYHEAADRIETIFEKEIKSWISGTYRYEGEGMGGDFEITLNPDGTYTFSEGPLSSYRGAGIWMTYYHAVYMTEENGLELQLMFGVEENLLIYLESGSDGFPSVKLPDKARFIRLKNDGEKPAP